MEAVTAEEEATPVFDERIRRRKMRPSSSSSFQGLKITRGKK
jgi:hypothetical protein